MPEDIYELISLGARYWFALLGVLIVLRSFSWLRKDRRAKHKRLKRLPDAGMIGEMVVLRGSDELPEGCAIPVPREGTLGFLRTCDMVVPVDGVAPHHIDFAFQDGRGLLLFPWNGCECTMDGEELTARSKTKHFPMHHGSRLQVGDALLRLRLFAGLETEHRSAFAPDMPDDMAPLPEAETEDWQETPYVYHQVPASWTDTTGRYAPVPPQGWQNPGTLPQPWQDPPYGQQNSPYGQPEQPWMGPDWHGKGWGVETAQQPYGQHQGEQLPLNDQSFQQEMPWPVENWGGEMPESAPEDDFEPIRARQRRSRFRRRSSNEEEN